MKIIGPAAVIIRLDPDETAACPNKCLVTGVDMLQGLATKGVINVVYCPVCRNHLAISKQQLTIKDKS